MRDLIYYYLVNDGDPTVGGPFNTEDEREADLREFVKERGLDDMDDLFFLELEVGPQELNAYAMTISGFDGGDEDEDADL